MRMILQYHIVKLTITVSLVLSCFVPNEHKLIVPYYLKIGQSSNDNSYH